MQQQNNEHQAQSEKFLELGALRVFHNTFSTTCLALGAAQINSHQFWCEWIYMNKITGDQTCRYISNAQHPRVNLRALEFVRFFINLSAALLGRNIRAESFFLPSARIIIRTLNNNPQSRERRSSIIIRLPST